MWKIDFARILILNKVEDPQARNTVKSLKPPLLEDPKLTHSLALSVLRRPLISSRSCVRGLRPSYTTFQFPLLWEMVINALIFTPCCCCSTSSLSFSLILLFPRWMGAARPLPSWMENQGHSHPFILASDSSTSRTPCRPAGWLYQSFYNPLHSNPFFNSQTLSSHLSATAKKKKKHSFILLP